MTQQAKTLTVKQIIADILKREGGYVNHPDDRGGPTNYGITAMSYAEYFRRKSHSDVTIAEIKSITPATAEKIYYTLYYVRPNIVSLPVSIQPIVFDMAVNHGCQGAVQILQNTLSDYRYDPGAVDGLIGKKTIDAATKAANDLGVYFLNAIIGRRIKYYQDIIKNDPSQAVFEDGWIARAESFRTPTA